MNTATVRSNLESIYADLGVTITAPTFEDYIDNDGDGILAKNDDDEPDAFTLTNVSGAEAMIAYASNTVTLAGLSESGTTSVSTNQNGAIIKNGSVISGLSTTVVNGNTLALSLTSPSFGVIVSASLTLPSQTKTWSLTTRTPIIRYKSADGNFPFPNSSLPGDDQKKYHAFPLLMSETFTAKYIGSGFNAGTNPTKVSIYSDNSNVPGTELASSTSFADYFGSTSLQNTVGSTQTSLSSLGFESYLGSDGLAITSGDRVWLVFQFYSAADPGSIGNSAVGFSQRKVSSDGSSWSNYQGQANGRYSGNMPMVLLTD
jgi:hypothetical protein